MIEVFKTNVQSLPDAYLLIRSLSNAFSGCEASFDLDDCDRILRIKTADVICHAEIVQLLHTYGFDAAPLPD